MLISVNSIRIIDSFNFIPMSLSAMPKAFGIEDTCKGFFPHLFNTLENEKYIGEWPDAFYYTPATMKSTDYETFMKWYFQQTTKVPLNIKTNFIFLKSLKKLL